MKKAGVLVSGWLCIVLGVAGLALPILPGWLFFLLGLLILSPHYAWAQRLLARTRRMLPPKVSHLADVYRTRATLLFTRVQKGGYQMRLHVSVKYMIVGLAILAAAIEGTVIDNILLRHAINPLNTIWDDVATGGTLGIILFGILTLCDKAKEDERRRARVIAEMNHHVRNALQVIQFSADSPQAIPVQRIKDAVKRIDWALREVLLDQPPPAS